MRSIRLSIIGAAVVVAFSTPHAHAQSAPSSPKDQENAVNILRQQRNEQSDLVAGLAVRAAALERELAEVKEKLAACKPHEEKK